MDRNRFGLILCGAQRSGKSYLTNMIIENYMKGGGSALVYNLGKEHKDFLSCELCQLLTMREHYNYIKDNEGLEAAKDWKRYGKEFRYIRSKDNGIFHIEDFNELYKGKGIRVKKLPKDFEDCFFYAYYEYVSNTFLAFDDCKNMFPNNLRAWQDQLLGRMNHTGSNHKHSNYKDAGSELAFIYHNLDQVPSSIIDYYNDDYTFISFKYKEEPSFNNIGDRELFLSLKHSFRILSNLPKYSYTEFHKGKTRVNKFREGKNYLRESFIID